MRKTYEAIVEGYKYGVRIAIAIVLVCAGMGLGLKILAWVIGVPL